MLTRGRYRAARAAKKEGPKMKRIIGDHRGQWDVMGGQWEVMGGQ